MANCAKWTRNAMPNIFAHCDRTQKHNHNEKIDHSRTHLNYNLAPEGNQNEILKNRLSQVKVLKRKDVNVVCSWVVTIPKDFQGNQEDFFKATYNFLEERYKKENVISAYVHLDETTPHMHFLFVPVVFDKKKEIEKVSAKEVLTRVELQKFHPQLKKYLENELKQPVSILNGATANGNATIKQLKAETALKEAEQTLAEAKTAAANEQERMKKESSETRRLLTARSVELDNKETKLKQKQAYFNDIAENGQTYLYALQGEFALHDKSPQKLSTQELKYSVKRVIDSMAAVITSLRKKISRYRSMTPQQLRNTANAMETAQINTLGAYEDAQLEKLQSKQKKQTNNPKYDWGR